MVVLSILIHEGLRCVSFGTTLGDLYIELRESSLNADVEYVG